MALGCLIVDDNKSFVAAARKILDAGGLTVLGEAATAGEALERAGQLSPDVVLLDIDLDGESGFDVARELAGRAADDIPAIVLISAYPEDDFADLIAEAPAVGFVSKSELSSAVILDLVHRRGVRGTHRESR